MTITDGIGGAPARKTPKGRGLIWPAMIIGLLAMNATIVATTVYFAVTDRSEAIEPDYYARALRFDETIAQRATNTGLGWTAEPSLVASPGGQGAQLAVELADREGVALAGASVHAELFSNLRASQRQSVSLTPSGAGRYTAPVRIDRSGIWQVRLRVERGETFTHDTQLMVP